MKSVIRRITGTVAATSLLLGLSMVNLSGTANAIPWTSDATGLSQPAFNVFTGVPNYGDESDFVRGRVSGTANEFSDPVNDVCADGTQYTVRVYVHNAANQTLNNNGTGPGVARNTKVKVSLPATTANPITGTISADNAATVNDNMTINCNGKVVQLSYVKGSAIQQNMAGATAPLADSIVTTGAQVGTQSANGDVWGCFGQRVLVYIKVQVKEVPVVIPPPSTGECKAIEDFVTDAKERRVSLKVTGTVNNAQIIGYRIDWGDGTTSDKQSDSHVYAKEGTYNIVGSVVIRYADGRTETKSAVACTKKVTFEKDKVIVPPATPVKPVELPKTGAGSMVGIFSAVSMAGAVAHRYFTSRRYNG